MRSINSFVARWMEAMWTAMARTGHGYRRYKLGHTGKGKDRRPDKLASKEPSFMRRYRNRYS